jgi:hypothetical protein
MGAQDATDGYFVQQTSTPAWSGRFGKTSTASTSTVIPIGSIHVDRSSSTKLDVYVNGVGTLLSTTSVTPAATTLPWYVMARNNAGTPAQWTAGPFAAYWVADTMTAAEALDFHNAINALQTALGRAVV